MSPQPPTDGMAGDGDETGAAPDHPAERIAAAVVALIVFLMMGLTLVDVVGRYLFSRPVPGAFELIEMMMALIIFGALPLATKRNEHIVIDLLAKWLRAIGLRRAQQIAVNLASAMAVGFVGYNLWLQGEELAHTKQSTAFLQLPIAPLAYVMSLLSAATVIVFLYSVWRLLKRDRSRSTGIPS